MAIRVLNLIVLGLARRWRQKALSNIVTYLLTNLNNVVSNSSGNFYPSHCINIKLPANLELLSMQFF